MKGCVRLPPSAQGRLRVILSAVLLTAFCATAAERFFRQNLLPPPAGQYVCDSGAFAAFPGGVVVSNAAQRLASASVSPPPPGTPTTLVCSATVELGVSTDAGATWSAAVVSTAAVSFTVTWLSADGGMTTYTNAMTQFNLAGGTLPDGVQIRESPSRASGGRTTVRPDTGGYRIDSFFDVFLEVSTNSGGSWAAAGSAVRLSLAADAAAFAAAGAPRTVLPMPNGACRAEHDWRYSNGIVVHNALQRLFSAWVEPPGPGQMLSHTCDLQIDLEYSSDGGATFAAVRAPAVLSMQVRHAREFQGRTTYETEMMQLSIAGGDLPGGVMIRESPTKASGGGVCMAAGGGGGGAGGGAAISSFFDIYTEVSTDGGANWFPATNGPAYAELSRIAPVRLYTNNWLPPAVGQYQSPPEWQGTRANNCVVSNLTLRAFTASTPPPAPGGTVGHTCGAQADLRISQDGGLTFSDVSAAASVAMQITGRTGGDGVTDFYDTEMTQLDISGLPAGVMIRESPTKASLGRTTISSAIGGDQIDSFFDIFIEVSTDGGQSWYPAQTGPDPVTLVGGKQSAFEFPGAKWWQPPDSREQFGLDVHASKTTILADDFLCTTNGAITNIIVWGSWSNNVLPTGGATNLRFTLSIHADIPKGTGGTNWSRPGAVLWYTNFLAGKFLATNVFDVYYEGWLTPSTTNYIPSGDWTCWQYTFPIDPATAFVQTGTVRNPIVYWLDVKAHNIGGGTPNFGWKTTTNHWGDDAVWGAGSEPYQGPWYELRYPPGHPLAGQSIDLAFALMSGSTNPTPEEPTMDYGDAPAPYPTTFAQNGARHKVTGFYLGNAIDGEADGQPDANALGDDQNGPAPWPPGDEDGVTFLTPLNPGALARVNVVVTGGNGCLSAWMDFNADGDWADPGEQIFSAQAVVAGANLLTFPVPPGATVTNRTFARFRLHTGAAVSYTGYVPYGEVEDYKVAITGPPESKMHYAQEPDLFGTDVLATAPLVLADDFRCTQTGPITNIIFWGSWFEDQKGTITNLHLSIHADDRSGAFSKPGELLWQRDVGGADFVETLEGAAPQSWYNAASGLFLENNHSNCYRYTVPVPLQHAFYQTTGTIYWIDVSAGVNGGVLGWKTSRSPHFEDDAAWAVAAEQLAWIELRHPVTRESLDLAFAIQGAPEEPDRDFGDAPAPYPTLMANGGARHHANTNFCLGQLVDTEADGQPNATATGDDANGLADEDGVVFTSALVPGANATATVTLINNMPGWLAFLDGWVDFNADGDWADAGERIFNAQPLNVGANYLNFAVPATAAGGQTTYARFRLSWVGGLPCTGPDGDGEVEDYQVFIESLDFGDAPDSYMVPRYPTYLINNGARHVIVQGAPYFADAAGGDAPDAEVDGQPNATATGDDIAGADDEDGVTVPVLTVGVPANITGILSSAGWVDAWVDWNGDGDWNDAGENIFSGLIGGGPFTLLVTAPGPFIGQTFARFRVHTGTAALLPTGLAGDGEVEDHEVLIKEPPPEEFDFGDAPDSFMVPRYPTYLINNGARHKIVQGAPYFADALGGDAPDAEVDGQPNATATGDDIAGADDEDGVTVPVLTVGVPANITGILSSAGWVDAWVDWNGDGDWSDAGENVFSGPKPSGPFAIPVTAPGPFTGQTFARFRVHTGATALLPTGPADDGEVEDHLVTIQQPFPPPLSAKWRQPPDCTYGLNLASWAATGLQYAAASPVVADDWRCDGRPIDAIRWWGSYILYDGPTNALQVPRPDAFRLSWYLDYPTNAQGWTFSRPGPLLKQTTAPLLPYQTALTATGTVSEFYACTVPLDFLGPAFAGKSEHTFEYNVVLGDPWLEKNTLARTNTPPYMTPCSSNVYWLAVEALYNSPPEGVTNAWGWDTTVPRFNWNDDAVMRTNFPGGAPSSWKDLTYIPRTAPWQTATAHPWMSNSVNMAFELLSDVVGRRDVKWSQLPNMTLGTDMPSWRWLYPNPASTNQALRADDFISDGRRITDIHWWGSYIGWQSYVYTNEFGGGLPPPLGANRPLGFELSWHAHGANAPGAALTNVFVPIDRCHEAYYCTLSQLGSPYMYEHEYQYYVDLLDAELDTDPWCEQAGTQYWLNVQAVFTNTFIPAPPGEGGRDSPHEGWGWKISGISPGLRLCPSVVSNLFPPSPSWHVSLLPAWHPMWAKSHDLAFELTTDKPNTNATIVITSFQRDTNALATTVSLGTAGAGWQYLQSCTNSLTNAVWVDVETNAVPFPPPWTNIWLRPGAAFSNEFFRVIEQ
jgi:hypothetical protein